MKKKIMKLAICSDLHLEFGTIHLVNTDDADVLILSGDICVAKHLTNRDVYEIVSTGKSNEYHQFFQECCEQFPHVIYIAGNHEHYNGDFNTTYINLKKFLAYLPNLHILDKEIIEIDNTVFVGGTLWTDMNKSDPLTLHSIARMMNDFRCVKNSNRVVSFKSYDDVENPGAPTFHTRAALFSPEDAVIEHTKFLEYISSVYDNMQSKKQMVVVGHHTPSAQSCHPRYRADALMNGGYHSDLSEFILDRPRIKLWTHGHTHELFDYNIGGTRVFCNPRGYIGHEQCAKDFKLKFIEL